MSEKLIPFSSKQLAKHRVAHVTWKFFKIIGDLKLARTFSYTWNMHPADDFIKRNYNA